MRMEAFQNIQLSFKCPKALDELQPCQSNWYCDGCRKMVYDFRGMEEAQILQTFEQSGQKLCGIYDAHRIKVLPQQPRWIRASWTAVMALGITILNSCGWGKESKTITTIGVPIIEQPKITHTAGIVMPPNPDTTHHSKKKIKVKFPPPAALVGDVAITAPKDTDAVFGMVAEIMPSYPGGEEAFNTYMAKHITYDANVKKGFARFVVEKNGSLTDIQIIRGASKDIDEQLISALKKSPKWNPGMQNGKPYRVQYTVPYNVVYKGISY